MATSACVRAPGTPSPNACAVRPRTPAPSLLRQPGPCLSSALPLPRVSAVAAPTPATDTAPVRHLQWPRTGRTLHGAYCTEFSQHSDRNRPKLRAGALLGSTEPAAHRAAARGLAHRSALRPSTPRGTLRQRPCEPSSPNRVSSDHCSTPLMLSWLPLCHTAVSFHTRTSCLSP